MNTTNTPNKNTDTQEWKTGSVAGFSSKQLLEVTNGACKLIQIAPGASYPTHTHPHKTESLLVLEGIITVTINGITYQGKAHDFFVFPSGMSHSIANNTNKDCLGFIGAIKN